MILEVYACLDWGYMGVKTGSEIRKGPIYFLCKIEISKFATYMCLIKETLQDVGTLHL